MLGGADVTFRVIISAFALALFLLGTGGASVDTTDGPGASDAAVFAVAELAAPEENSLEDALALLSSSSQASDNDNETEELCAVGTVARCSNQEMRPGRTLAHRWHPHNAGAPPVPPPQDRAGIRWTVAGLTDLHVRAKALGRRIGSDAKLSLEPLLSAHPTASLLPSAPSIRSAAAQDASRRRSPPKHLFLSSSDSLSRPLARAFACASERQCHLVRVSTPFSMKLERWGTS